MTTVVRDTQRQRLYDAEAQVLRQLELAAHGARTLAVAGSTVTLPLELRFGSLDAVQRYARGTQAADFFGRRWPRAAAAPLSVRPRRGDGQATYEPPGTIALHPAERGQRWALRELVVLHEVAHHVVAHELPGSPAHGPAYAGVLVRLVTDAMSAEVGLLLTAAFAEHGVALAPVA